MKTSVTALGLVGSVFVGDSAPFIDVISKNLLNRVARTIRKGVQGLAWAVLLCPEGTVVSNNAGCNEYTLIFC